MKKPFLLLLVLMLPLVAVAESTPSSDPVYGAVFNDLEGQPSALSRLRGKVAVVNFWATWCPPCRKEIPDLVEAYGKYKGSGVEFIGIAVEDGAELVKEFARIYEITYPLATGKDKGIELMQALGNGAAGLPYTLVLDAKGNVVASRRGQMNASMLEKALQAALGAAE